MCWSSFKVNTGPSKQTYLSPTLHLPHFPTPHFMRISSEVRIFSGGKPSSTRTGTVNLIIIGGPHIKAKEFPDFIMETLEAGGIIAKILSRKSEYKIRVK